MNFGNIVIMMNKLAQSQETLRSGGYSDIATVPIPVISTYHWQWKTLQSRAGEKE